MPDPKILAALRTLVSASKLPARQNSKGIATGVRAIDDVLGGGLPPGRLTELVAPLGTGGQSVLASVLATARASQHRVALVDASDAFTPEAHDPDLLKHLVWARAKGLRDALVVADIIVRDGNYSVIVLDLRDVPEREFSRTQKSVWHRLHRIAERQPAAVLVQTGQKSVPAVRWRLSLTSGWKLSQLRQTRASLLQELTVMTTRGLHEELRTA